MRTQSIDTSPEAERVQIAILRRASTSKRFYRTGMMSRSTIVSAQRYLQQLQPGISEQETMFLSVEHPLGKPLVRELRQVAAQRQILPAFSTINMQSVLFPVFEALEEAGIACALSGSLACCLYGMEQHVEQICIIADLGTSDETFLQEFLPSAFYSRLADIQSALAAKTATTYYHLPSLFTIQLAFPQARMDEWAMLKRARPLVLVEGISALPVLAPEDIALLTLDRVRAREEELVRQGRKEQADDIWNELLGILKVQGPELDLFYIEQQALRFNLLPAMHHAFEDAGLRE